MICDSDVDFVMFGGCRRTQSERKRGILEEKIPRFCLLKNLFHGRTNVSNVFFMSVSIEAFTYVQIPCRTIGIAWGHFFCTTFYRENIAGLGEKVLKARVHDGENVQKTELIVFFFFTFSLLSYYIYFIEAGSSYYEVMYIHGYNFITVDIHNSPLFVETWDELECRNEIYGSRTNLQIFKNAETYSSKCAMISELNWCLNFSRPMQRGFELALRWLPSAERYE